ncbi:MAG: ArsR/SmtB family transcription factor, partial [Candidatus Hodarchaeota archaeon]
MESPQIEPIIDPFLLQDIIFAFSDQIRIKILKFLSEMTEENTGTIAKAVGKATNTILYHLNILNEAGIIDCKLKRNNGREIYHWSIKNNRILLQIDIDLFASKEHSLDTYALRTLIFHKKRDQPIGTNFQQELDSKKLATLLRINQRLAKTLIDKIDLIQIVDTLYRKIYSELMSF